ncbi:hypothetical protein ACFFX1_44230 [Dactylosporangium sucinum]|uniref:Uncharacterized protein n=1 Tax=Dactylosporangium sucinum TaxID=1424081 RepID=A0A917TRS3_9ACTN|nr:hypothetical protein [Dactylosporangium sucinum]GGM35030.1 hypothetical protein GCM10007977_040680 [Dactylosporangium sucinum]
MAHVAGADLGCDAEEDDLDIGSRLGRAVDAQLAGESRVARQRFEHAYELAEQRGDVRGMAVAVLGQAGLRVAEVAGVDGTVMLDRLRRLERLVDPASSIGLRIRVRLAGELDHRAGTYDAILAALDEATRAGDTKARALALSLAHHCLLGPDHGDTRRRLALELIGESSRTRRRDDLLIGMLWYTLDLLVDGDRQTERQLLELRALLAQAEHRAVGCLAGVMEVTLAVRAGRFEHAQALAEQVYDAGTEIGDDRADAFYAAHLLGVHWFQGRLTELLPVLEQQVHSPSLRGVDSSLFAALAVAAATAGDRLTAAGAVGTLCGRDLAELPHSSGWLPAMFGIAEAAHLLDDVETSARVYELVTPYAHLPAVASFGSLCLGSAEHALGVAALTMGRLDLAVGHFAAAIRANLALWHRPAVLVSRARYAQALARRNGDGDGELARSVLAAAGELAAALGVSVPGFPDGVSGEARTATCTRTGQQWLVQYGRRTALIPHSVGMSYVAALLANPGRDVSAVDLAAGPDTRRRAARTGHAVLDRAAVQQYRQRVGQLNEHIERLESMERADELASMTAERDWILGELRAATGLAGRIRSFTNESERARIAVGKAIRRALAAVDGVDSVIAAHLRASIHTGTRCSYRPA